MTRKLVLVVFLLMAFSSTLFAQQLDPVTKWATIAAYEYQVHPNIVYGKANNVDLKLDVITAGPASQKRPTVIYIHGGGWVGGSKEYYALWPLPFLAKGMNVVNVEYRLAHVSLAPAAVEDCRCALRWVYRNAPKYGFDTSKLVVAGHSAGGHLALMTGMLPQHSKFDNECAGNEDLKVAAIVNFFGITDVADLLQGPDLRNWALEWFGSQPNRMELARQLSPLTYVRKGLPPIISIQGDKDTLVPYHQSVDLERALNRAGVPNQLVTIPGGGHGGWTRSENMRAEEAVFNFLQAHGVLPQ
ncbi:MAG: alpha/beta hydrolase [Acidobacteria bacterium]|nr:alpha/beta hydrolase [Acidobacteriota bacterium]